MMNGALIVDRFREAVGTIAAEAGIEEPPEFCPAHTFSSMGAAPA
jgi:hypothetical protein